IGLNDPNPANNSATDTSTITSRADLNITVTDAGAIAGTKETYTIVVSNAGPSDVTGAVMTDTFSSLFTDVSFTATQNGGASGFTPSGAGNIGDTVTMPVGSRISYTARGTIDALAQGPLSNTATTTAPGGVTDPNLANNSASDIDIPMYPTP